MDEKMTRSIEECLKTLTNEEIQANNEQERKMSEKYYQEFKEAFSKGMCSLCGSSLRTISNNKPCLHWLLKMCKFRKKDFKLLYPTVGFFQMNAYVRWVANLAVFMKNINDLNEEKDQSKLIETTIKYKHIEWSFSCSKNDFEGHLGSQFEYPHYHFQMRINGQRFIDYGDYHIPLKEADIFNIILVNKYGAVESYGIGGAGMQEGISINPDDIINHSKVCSNKSKATYNISTVAEFEGGKSREEIARLIEESNRTGQLMTKLLIDRGAKTKSIITPHESVPQIAKRHKRNKR